MLTYYNVIFRIVNICYGAQPQCDLGEVLYLNKGLSPMFNSKRRTLHVKVSCTRVY